MIIIASYSNVSVTYIADGTQTVFSFPFDYLRKAFVKVEVNEEIILVQGTDYTVSDNKTVVLTEAPESGTIVRVFRETSTTRLVSWADASVLRAKDMTIQQVQNLHILEEQQYWVTENAIIRQGKEWNARNFPIKNVGDPVDPKDATTKKYVDDELDTAIENLQLLADIVVDSEELQHITDQFNAIDENAEIAANAAETAVDSATSANASKNSASASATSATNTANALINFLETKETLTAPAVDPILTISGAAADSKVVGDNFNLLLEEADVSSTFDSTESGIVYNTTTPTGTSYSGGHSYIKAVSAGTKYKITTTILPQTSYYAVLLYDNTTYKSGVYQGTAGSNTPITDYEFVIPSGINKIIVSTLNAVTPTLKQVVPTTKVDDTLSLAGVPADAKAVGDNFADVRSSFKETSYFTLTPISTISGYKACYSNNKLYLSPTSGHVTKVYRVEAGAKYRIRSYGYDVNNYDVAMSASALISGGQSTAYLEIFLCGGSTYPQDCKNHDMDITPQYSGYLYINEKTSTGAEAFCSEPHNISAVSNGLLVQSGTYYHFVRIDNIGRCLVRQYKRRGPNNLLQLYAVGIGYIVEGIGYSEETTINPPIGTDIVGPVSMYRTGMPAYGVWAGGNHSVTVGGVACPTAEQTDLKIYVSGKEITTDGIYYGDAKIVATNKIYFAQTITGNTFTGATPAFTEKRTYILKDSMKVNVELTALADVSVVLYYGMQYVNTNVVSILVPNDEYVHTDMTAVYVMSNQQPDIVLQYANNINLHMLLDREGLGSYARNNRQSSTNGYGVIASYGKTYHVLISNSSVPTGKHLYWSGEYRYDV